MSLVSIGGGHTLAPESAASWKRMAAAGMPAGGLTSSSRTEARQWELYNNQGKPGWPPLAAHPKESKHVYRPKDTKDRGGRAVDVDNPTRAWLIKNGAKHGWHRPIASEPWHFEYRITHDTHLEDDMAEVEISKKQIKEIAEAVSEHKNKLSPAAADINNSSTMTVRLGLQQNVYVRRDVRTLLAHTKAIEQAVNKGTSVSAADVARELRPLLAADVRAAVTQAVAGLPTKDADKIAQAVVERFAAVLAGED